MSGTITAAFLAAHRLWLLVVVGVLAIGYVITQLRRRKAAVRFSNLALLDRIAPRSPGWRRHLVAVVYLAALTTMVVAIAQPVGTIRVAKERSTILLAIDTSLSMEAEDVEPNRIEAAKTAAASFVARVPENLQIGLVSFHRDVALEVAPTTDRNAVVRAIRRLQLGEGTAIVGAVEKSVEAVRQLPKDEDGKRPPAIVVLLSDGENTYPIGPDGEPIPTEEAIPPAKEAGVPVYTIAYGTPSGTITADSDGDGFAEQIPVAVNSEALAAIAEQTGGQAYRAATVEDLTEVYERLGNSVGYEEEQRELTWQYAAWAFAGLALASMGSLLWSSRLP